MPNRLIKKGEEVTILYLSTPKHNEATNSLLNEIIYKKIFFRGNYIVIN